MDLTLECLSAGSVGPSAAHADSRGSVLGLGTVPPPLDVGAVLMGVLVEEIRRAAVPFDELKEEADAIIDQSNACGDDDLRKRTWAHYMRVWTARTMQQDSEDFDALLKHAVYMLQAFGCVPDTDNAYERG